MKKQNVFLGSLLSGGIRIPCLIFLLLLLSACGSGGSADNGSSNNSSGLDSNGSSSVSAGANRDAGLGNGSATLMATRDILWKTDGTSAGTVQVPISSLRANVSYAYAFTEFNGAYYFQANDGVSGFELWKTDGTPVGTVPAEDFNTAAGWLVTNLYNGFIVFNSALYIPADDGVNGKEMWRTDGTTAGTALLKDINTENGGRRSDYLFNEFTVFNGALYFQAKDNVNGYRLWKTDGSAAGTVLLKTLTYAPASGFQAFNGALYFTLGSSLWKTDGTAAGTVLVSAS